MFNFALMNLTTKQIAEEINGTLEGDSEIQISQLSKIEEGMKGSISFLANPKYTDYIYSTKASAVVVSNDFNPSEKISTTLIRVKDPYQSFTDLLELYNSNQNNSKGKAKTSIIDKSSSIGDNAFIDEYVIIKKNTIIGKNCNISSHSFIGYNVKIGDNIVIYPGVKILDDTIIGDNCIIHSCSVIGSDGFGFAPLEDGSYKKIPQTGNVIIKDNVEIGSNCTIDRATIGSTIINNGVKFDNQIQIAHNVEIGENTVIAAQCGIAGSTKIGKNCMFGGQVGVIGHLKVGDNVKIAAQSGVTSDIEDNQTIQGMPAIPSMNFNRSYIHFKNLPEIVKKIDKNNKDK